MDARSTEKTLGGAHGDFAGREGHTRLLKVPERQARGSGPKEGDFWGKNL